MDEIESIICNEDEDEEPFILFSTYVSVHKIEQYYE